MKILFCIMISLINLLTSFSMNLENLSLEDIKEKKHMFRQMYDHVDNMVLKAQVHVVLTTDKYLSKDNKLVTKDSVREALYLICFPFKTKVYEDWVEENIKERVEEYISSLSKTFYTEGEFIKLVIKFNPKEVIGHSTWNKLNNMKFNEDDIVYTKEDL